MTKQQKFQQAVDLYYGFYSSLERFDRRHPHFTIKKMRCVVPTVHSIQRNRYVEELKDALNHELARLRLDDAQRRSAQNHAAEQHFNHLPRCTCVDCLEDLEDEA